MKFVCFRPRLDRNRCLVLGQRMRPIHMKQMRPVMQSVLTFLDTASQLGKVQILTNSAPGWVEASCKQFFPGLWARVSEFECHPKPIGCHIGTFKIDKLKFEAQGYRNIISIGDGSIERTACLRLQSPDRRIKSIKFKEAPSISQLLSELETLQQRLPDICRHDGNLDLRSQFVTENSSSFGSHHGSSMMRLSSILVHMTRLGQPPSRNGNGQSTALPRLCPGSSPGYSTSGGRGGFGLSCHEEKYGRSSMAKTGERFMQSHSKRMPSIASQGYAAIHGRHAHADTHFDGFGRHSMLGRRTLTPVPKLTLRSDASLESFEKSIDDILNFGSA